MLVSAYVVNRNREPKIAVGNEIIDQPQPLEVVEEVQNTSETLKIEPESTKHTEVIEELGSFKLTAYCPCFECSGGWGTNTASGAICSEGVTVAVDPSVIPLGSTVVIDGQEYTAQDVGGAIKGNRIDVYFDSHEAALEFGVQHKQVGIVREVD